MFAFLASCAGSGTYSSVSTTQPHAIVKTEKIYKSAFPLVISATGILEIDGKAPNYWRWDDTFRVSPGTRTLGLQNYGFNSTAMTIMSFNALAGKTYLVKSDESSGLKIKFWIEEKESKQIVASKEAARQPNPRTQSVPIFIPVYN